MARERQLPVKLYFRIGEVADIVGVEPHVLRYWETEFRTIRPQKSSKGQRIYSRRDVEKLLRVKDLLYTQGFTIAGARKRLREGGGTQAQGSDDKASLQKLRGALTDVRRDVLAMLDELGADEAPGAISVER